jgi:hypothetical protein
MDAPVLLGAIDLAFFRQRRAREQRHSETRDDFRQYFVVVEDRGTRPHTVEHPKGNGDCGGPYDEDQVAREVRESFQFVHSKEKREHHKDKCPSPEDDLDVCLARYKRASEWNLVEMHEA